MKWVLAFTTIIFLVPATTLAGNGPCTADKLKFCRASTADVDAIRFCLLEHKDELSGACEARLQEELGAVGETHSDN
jgi:hypothetical protein